MARQTSKTSTKKASKKPSTKPAKTAGKAEVVTTRLRPLAWLRRWAVRGGLAALLLVFLMVLSGRWINPLTTPYMLHEKGRLGGIDQYWVPIEGVAPVMARAVVAAEDADFCEHWGFDVSAIRSALDAGAYRGASTISQQVVKNVYLWQGRSWLSKALEALITPMMEALWTKERILEVYLNVAEFDEGVFGVEAAARHYFGVGPEALTPVMAARLAAILPAPKPRDAANPSAKTRARAAQILDGAATISRDGRAACFED